MILALHMGVSKHGGTPKSILSDRIFHDIDQRLWGYPVAQDTSQFTLHIPSYIPLYPIISHYIPLYTITVYPMKCRITVYTINYIIIISL
jgi:hypothetical protein